MVNLLDQLDLEISQAAAKLGITGADLGVVRAPQGQGDWAVNGVIQWARKQGRKPQAVAQELVNLINLERVGIDVAKVTPAGYINFVMRPERMVGVLGEVGSTGRKGQASRVLVEFVSANPTGPLHLGHGRQAALGDVLCRVLEARGYDVVREYYYNDAGTQIENLVNSILLRMEQIAGQQFPMPSWAYQGSYVREMAREYLALGGEVDPEHLRKWAVGHIRAAQKETLEKFGVRFDNYFLESGLYEVDQSGRNPIDRWVELATERGHTYEKEGALWLRTTAWGDDQDRVIRRSTGSYTYFAPDVAYHLNKWARGFKVAINIQGADHHGTVTRVRAGLQAGGEGIDQGYPEYLLHQMVRVKRGGEAVKMSKRAAESITLDEVIEDVGADAVRYFFLSRAATSDVVLDLDLAKKQTEENPVFYIQMAHARLAGIFRQMGRDDFHSKDLEASGPLEHPTERAILVLMAERDRVLERVEVTREPVHLVEYLLSFARAVHHWYHQCRVIGASAEVQQARLALARASARGIEELSGLLGIDAPDRIEEREVERQGRGGR